MPRAALPARLALLSLCALLLAACSSEVPDTHPDQPVTKRKQAFKAMLRSVEPMGTMLRDKRYDPDAFAHLANELASVREQPWPHFGPDTNYPPTKALAAVWDKPAEFEQRKQEFMTASERLIGAAATSDEAQARSAYAAVQDSCKACHRDFRK